MAILHYTIGLPPERNGGSVQYAYGLMTEQAKSESVYALICGDTLFRGLTCKIKKYRIRNGIKIFKLTNPLTPTLIYGTTNPSLQHRDVNINYNNIQNFIKDNDIKIMHLHTLMGIHKDIVAFIKSLGVKIVYTSHDFHGICAHYNMIDYNDQNCSEILPRKCALCNCLEPSDFFLRFVNSSLYHFLKKNVLFSKIIKGKKDLVVKTVRNTPSAVSTERIHQFEELIDYYRTFFGIIDKFHFNSLQTKALFRKFIPNISGKVIPVITPGIKDNRRLINPTEIIKFGFIGNTSDYKGFPLLKKIVVELFEEGIRNLKILAYTGNQVGVDTDCPLIQYQLPYEYKDISKILYHLDGTIVPSKCYETFSLVTLESIAHGRPAIISDHVGAKDIVSAYSGDFIFSTPQQLKDLLKTIARNPQYLVRESERILSSPWNFSIANHTKELLQFYFE